MGHTIHPETDHRAEQVRLLYASLPAALGGSIVVAAGLMFLLRQSVPHSHLWAWTACLALPLGQGATIAWARRISPPGFIDDRIWLRRFRFGVGLTGLAWGLSSFLLFPEGNFPMQAIVVSAVAVVTAAALTSLAVDINSALRFALPALIPPIGRLLVIAEPSAIQMAVVLTVFLSFVAVSAMRTHHSALENIRLRTAATERERALALHEHLLERTGELAGVGGWYLDIEAGSLRWTTQTYRIYGADPKQAIDLGLALNRYPEQARLAVEKAISDATKHNTTFDLELPFTGASGEEAWVRTIGSPQISDGTVIGISGAIQDITARKKDEDALIAARAEADRASQAKSDFLSHMSHELRTPMNAVLGFAQLLASDPSHPLPPQHASYVDHILRAGKHLLHLINEILDLARVEAGKFQLNIESVYVYGVVDECVSLARPEAQARGVDIRIETADSGLVVLADRRRLKQILINLISNATKFNRKGGNVDIELTGKANSVKISVNRLWERYQPSKAAAAIQSL